MKLQLDGVNAPPYWTEDGYKTFLESYFTECVKRPDKRIIIEFSLKDYMDSFDYLYNLISNTLNMSSAKSPCILTVRYKFPIKKLHVFLFLLHIQQHLYINEYTNCFLLKPNENKLVYICIYEKDYIKIKIEFRYEFNMKPSFHKYNL